MSIDLIISLYTDENGQDRFRVDHPVNGDDIESPALVDVTDQFDLSVITMPNGQLGFCVFKKQPQPELSCLDSPTEF